MIKVRKDLSGKRVGKLVVIKQHENDYVSPTGRRAAQWKCLCDCGEFCIVQGCYLLNEDTKSCGCLQKESIVKENKRRAGKNRYDLSGEYGIGYTDDDREFWFDLEDYDRIKGYHWAFSKYGYVVSNTIKIHRLIMNITDENVTVDHIHGRKTKYDNRKSNLRPATKSQNTANSPLRKNNTSGVTGVTWNKNKQQWHARIKVNYKYIHLGMFDNFEDAVKVRKEAEKKYFGEFAYDYSQQLNIDEGT